MLVRSSSSSARTSTWLRSSPVAPGSYVPADETIEAFTRICDGVYDDVPEQAFSGIGGIDDLEEKWHNMQKELGA